MGTLSEDLKSMGYERTDEDSPFHDDGTLWSNGAELVCDKTGGVLSGHSNRSRRRSDDHREERHKYPNSEKIRMVGGYFSAYNWGEDEDGFYY